MTEDRCTIRIKSPVPVTDADVAAAIRGGALQQIFVHRGTNFVDVTFVHADDVLAFVEWANATPFYVGGRRVS